MSGFSAEWLALREPADLAARNAIVLEACAEAFAARESVSVCDLGAGTGASLRALSNLLPPRQSWTLVDYDAANLAIASAQLDQWAERSERGRVLTVRTLQHDLAWDAACWPEGTDLVTASAFFDLVSEAWIERFVGDLAAAGLPLLATLTFDGEIALDPPHPLDSAIMAAFRHHQGRDKGFGPAAGPDAADILVAGLSKAGYTLTEGDSPWHLRSDRAPLLQAFLDGVVEAVGETGLVPPADLAAWRGAASEAGRAVKVGHRDLFAVPGSNEGWR